MAPKKKNASQGSARSQTTAAKAKGAEKDQAAKSAKGVAGDERQAQREEPTNKTTAKSSSAATRDASKQPTQPARRDSSKQASFITRLRNSKSGRFMFDAYYELRHKVTWPTVNEVRNMTIAVIVLSLAIGLILGAVDFGLLNLFTFLSSRH